MAKFIDRVYLKSDYSTATLDSNSYRRVPNVNSEDPAILNFYLDAGSLPRWLTPYNIERAVMFVNFVININNYQVGVSGELKHEGFEPWENIASYVHYYIETTGELNREMSWNTSFKSNLSKLDHTKKIYVPMTLVRAGVGNKITFSTDKAVLAKRPYVEFEYTVFEPYISGATPNGSVVTPRADIVLRWNHNSSTEGTQVSFILNYSTDGGVTWVTKAETTSRSSYTIPANTFAGGTTVIWKVKTKDSFKDMESNEPTFTFTTSDTTQIAPTVIKPYGEYISVGEEVTFEWLFNGPSGESQTKYRISWKANNGSWVDIEKISTDMFHTFPSYTFPTGDIAWKVLTYNNYNEASPYSDEKTFFTIGKSATPVILSVSNSSKPLIQWESEGQQIFELEVLQGQTVIYKTGSIASLSIRKHKVEEYLINSTYKIRLRIKNEYGLWSEYGERTFVINTIAPPAPDIDVVSGEYMVEVTATGLSGMTLVYRDGILLGEIQGANFIDYTGINNKEYDYFVRTIDVEENFSDSSNIKGKCSFKGNTLALESDPSNFLLLKYKIGSRPGKSMTIGSLGELMYFDGREYPSYEKSEKKKLDKTLSFNINEEELNKLEELIYGGTLLYRDFFSRNIYGVVQQIYSTRTLKGYDIEFTINKVKEV